jgi:PHD/YefM family antitoxin component YafN of YafNO toxin-antitoxin module
MKTQFITNNNGQTIAVILPVKDYEKMMEDLDEMACIKAYDKAKARKQEFLPADHVFKAIERKRKHS